jgi:hypothetical protein
MGGDVFGMRIWGRHACISMGFGNVTHCHWHIYGRMHSFLADIRNAVFNVRIEFKICLVFCLTPGSVAMTDSDPTFSGRGYPRAIIAEW